MSLASTQSAACCMPLSLCYNSYSTCSCSVYHIWMHFENHSGLGGILVECALHHRPSSPVEFRRRAVLPRYRSGWPTARLPQWFGHRKDHRYNSALISAHWGHASASDSLLRWLHRLNIWRQQFYTASVIFIACWRIPHGCYCCCCLDYVTVIK